MGFFRLYAHDYAIIKVIPLLLPNNKIWAESMKRHILQQTVNPEVSGADGRPR
jgi:hypothetical protein